MFCRNVCTVLLPTAELLDLLLASLDHYETGDERDLHQDDDVIFIIVGVSCHNHHSEQIMIISNVTPRHQRY